MPSSYQLYHSIQHLLHATSVSPIPIVKLRGLLGPFLRLPSVIAESYISYSHHQRVPVG